LSGFDQRSSAVEALSEAQQKAGLVRHQIEHITVTGAGRKDVPFANDDVTEVGASARGAVFLFPSARTVIDVGAEEGRAVRCDSSGKVIDFAINEKCAAGAGAFTEAMARALEVKLEDFGALALKSQKAIPMNAQCAIFAESEVVSLIHSKTPKEDIARAVHDAIASRIVSMVRRIGVEKDVTLVGGLAKNIGFVESLKRELNTDLLIPKEPELVGALGAALIAAERSEKKR
ncbi:MAG: acyl-CoA dehydratase activase, partial [Candidatus Thermoplasmatota archaeon]|nr:acyl-CoA dehydratase activase [Candidatus Thermoplasmatota archaeon]